MSDLARATLEPLKDGALVVAVCASELGCAFGSVGRITAFGFVAVCLCSRPLLAGYKDRNGRPLALAICSTVPTMSLVH